MIYNLIPTNAYHIGRNIIQINNENLKITHHYFLIGKDRSNNVEKYTELFKKLGIQNFSFIFSKKKLFKIILSVKKCPIILHGDSYIWKVICILANCKNITWICWGSGININNSAKSKLSFYIKKWIYKRTHLTVCLIKQDEISFKKNFKYDNVITLPYRNILYTILDKLDLNQKNIRNNKPSVYLGNNSSHIKTYIDTLEILKNTSININIICMLNYNLIKNKLFKELKTKGEKYFYTNFNLDTHFRELNEYAHFMNKCDVYICNVNEQTGLGAIYSCLFLGKKIYLKGKNYEWIKMNKFIVSHINELPCSIDTFHIPLNEKEKLYNKKQITALLNDDKLKTKWNQLFDMISKNHQINC